MEQQQRLARQKRKPPRPPAALPAAAGLAAAMVTDRPKLERHSSMPRASLRHDAHERPRLERRASLPHSSSARATSLPHPSPAMQTPKPPPPQRAKSFARPSSASASLPENHGSRDTEPPARLRRSKSLAREPNRRRRSADERSVASNASHVSSPPKAHGRVGVALDLVKATPEPPGRPAVPGASAKVEAELAKLRKGWEAAEHRGIDLKVELLQTQV